MFSRGPSRAAAAPARPPPRVSQPAPQQSGGMLGGGGIGSMLMTGAALGAGSEVGHMAVRSLMGSGSGGHGEAPAQQAPAQQAPAQQYAQPGYAEQQQPVQEHPRQGLNTNFENCLKQNAHEIGPSPEYTNKQKTCKRATYGTNHY